VSTSKPYRILVVEDEPAARSALRDLLEIEGYAVESVAHGGVAIACQRAAPPDLLLTDLGLPDVDGLVVARTTRREAGCPVLVMTGSDRARHEPLGFELVMKPIDIDQLLVQLRRALAGRAS
jgi:two-component system, OmpR family, KDP operon response regulator KdpE